MTFPAPMIALYAAKSSHSRAGLMRRGWQRRGAKCWDQGKEWKFSTNRRARRQDTRMEYEVSRPLVAPIDEDSVAVELVVAPTGGVDPDPLHDGFNDRPLSS